MLLRFMIKGYVCTYRMDFNFGRPLGCRDILEVQRTMELFLGYE